MTYPKVNSAGWDDFNKQRVFLILKDIEKSLSDQENAELMKMQSHFHQELSVLTPKPPDLEELWQKTENS